MYRVYNKTFQPIQIIYRGDTLIIPRRAKNAFVEVEEVNEQLEKLSSEEIIKIKEVK